MRKGTSLFFLLLNFSFWGNCRFTYSCRKILCICYPVSHNGNISQNYFLFCFVFTHSSTCSHRWATVFKTEMNHMESWKFGYIIKGLLTKMFFTEKSMVIKISCSLHDCLIAYYNPNWKGIEFKLSLFTDDIYFLTWLLNWLQEASSQNVLRNDIIIAIQKTRISQKNS